VRYTIEGTFRGKERRTMKKKIRKIGRIVVCILLVLCIGAIHTPIQEKIANKEKLQTANVNRSPITTYDLTGLATGSEVSHDCNVYLTTRI